MEYCVKTDIYLLWGETKYKRINIMTTQYTKNNKYMAVCNYRRREKKYRLKGRLITFFSLLSIICTCIYIIISST